jgi:hypothetical protein
MTNAIDHYAIALNGIHFEWTPGQSPRGQFDIRFSEVKEFKNNHDTVSFLGEDKNNFPKLATWTAYAKSMAIKVLNKEAANSVFTLIRIKKVIDVGSVPQFFTCMDHQFPTFSISSICTACPMYISTISTF